MIWIRADANKEIGSGHIMRCLSVAEELKKCGAQVLFVVADGAATELLSQRAQAYYVLGSDYRDMEAELPLLNALYLKSRPDLILTDSYFVTEHYLNKLSIFAKTVYMDDRLAFPYPTDMVIDYNIYADTLPYRETAHVKTKQFLLGTDYVPLREEFKNIPYESKDEVTDVLITTGGSDKYNLAGRILTMLLAEKRTKVLQYHVVSGAFNSNFPELKKIEAKYPNVHIYQNVTRMSELMKRCDVAITAAGSTLYELCAVGIPILCFSFADNQRRMVQSFARKELAHFGGDYEKDGEKMLQELSEKLCELMADKEVRKYYQNKARLLVDGKGALRIAEKLYEFCAAGRQNERNYAETGN